MGAVLNCLKKSLSLNLKSKEGSYNFSKLLKTADVILENFIFNGKIKTNYLKLSENNKKNNYG